MFNRHYRYKRETREYQNREKKENYVHDHSICGCSHDHSIIQEFICHIPIALFSLCFSFLFIELFISIIKNISNFNSLYYEIFNNLFHISHYIHILLAGFASIVLFLNFSPKSFLFGFFMSVFNSIFFCTLSDVVLPSIATFLLGFNLKIHICFFHLNDTFNILTFVILGAIGGICLIKGDKQRSLKISKFVSMGHIAIGCIASFLYILSQINVSLVNFSGLFLIMLLLIVIIPCTLSDVLIPIFLSKWYVKKNNFYDNKKNTDFRINN
jgi:hypothetical protein